MAKNLPADAEDSGSISGWGRSPGGGHGNSLQYSCLENPMDRGAWRATVHGVTESQKQLSTCARLVVKASQEFTIYFAFKTWGLEAYFSNYSLPEGFVFWAKVSAI